MLAASLGFASPVAAQVVAIKATDQNGHGFMLRHNGTCYVILPAHVAGKARRVTVLTATPVANAEAMIEQPFWPGLDLAIGPMRGAAADQCTETLASLDGMASPEAGGNLDLVRLRASGEVERLSMRYTSSAFLTLEAEMLKAGEEFFQGTSGAFLFQNDKPVGMVIETPAPTMGRFIRIEHIKANAQLWLDRRSGTFASAAAATLPQGEGIAFEVMSATQAPVSPDQSPSNLAGAGAYVFAPQGVNRVVLRINGGTSTDLRKVILTSNPEAGYALPRNVQIEVSTRKDGASPRGFFKGEMAPDGLLEARHPGTYASWVILTFTSAWSDGPVGVEDIHLE